MSSILKVNQIKSKLLEMFKNHLDLTEIGETDQEREVKILSRCLAAFAVYLKTGCSEKDAGQSVWDGTGDNGIDAAYYDPTERQIILVQSKWIQKGSGEPDAKDISTFMNGVRDFIENDQDNFDKRLHSRLSDIYINVSTPGVSVCVIVASTGASNLAAPAQRTIARLLDELNGDDTDQIATNETMGLTEIYNGLARDPAQGAVNVDANILDWSYISTPYPAYFGIIDGLQIKEWWKKFGKRILSDNIRHSLGSTDVNTQIKSTAVNSPEHFWYFNNGITLIADAAEKAPAGAASRSAGIFSLKRASIVNGAQTVSTIGKIDNDVSLGKARIPIRIVLLEGTPKGFGGEVTRTNNLQNRIESRDFVAQDPEQMRLRQEMALEGVDYQFVRSEDAIQTTTTCELIELTTALACASCDPLMAVNVKTGIGRFFSDLNKAPYKTLFNPNLSGARAFNAVIVQRSIDHWIDIKKKNLMRKSGVEWGALVHGNRILAAAVFSITGSSNLSEPIKKFTVDNNFINNSCELIYMEMVNAINNHYSGKFLAVLFKNPKMSKHVFDCCVENAVKSSLQPLQNHIPNT